MTRQRSIYIQSAFKNRFVQFIVVQRLALNNPGTDKQEKHFRHFRGICIGLMFESTVHQISSNLF